MTQTYYPARPRVQEDMPDDRFHRRQIAQHLINVEGGRVDCTLSVTLDAGSATTTVIDSRISLSTAPLLIPVTANAAAEIAAGGLYVVLSAVAPKQTDAVIHHANSAATDRTFQMALLG